MDATATYASAALIHFRLSLNQSCTSVWTYPAFFERLISDIPSRKGISFSLNHLKMLYHYKLKSGNMTCSGLLILGMILSVSFGLISWMWFYRHSMRFTKVISSFALMQSFLILPRLCFTPEAVHSLLEFRQSLPKMLRDIWTKFKLLLICYLCFSELGCARNTLTCFIKNAYFA